MMMKLLSSRIFWGVVLVIGGALLLLDTFGIFKGGELFWTVVSGIVGLLFLSLYLTNHDHWWALIPGIIFLAIAAMIGLNSFLPGFNNTNLAGTIVLGGIALSFLVVYLAERRNWWAIIPAGVMATIALVAGLEPSSSSTASGGIFFFGLGVTFVLVAILPTSVGQMRWAWIPAGILGLMGILILIAAENLINYIWPIFLILAGILLIIRSIRRR
jgi:hypothetical protein